jgi:hypothetical protein
MDVTTPQPVGTEGCETKSKVGKPVTAMIRDEDYLAVQKELAELRAKRTEAYQTMVASEQVLRREWETREEDEAWADL